MKFIPYLCNARPLMLNKEHERISKEHEQLTDKLLLEKIPLASIARINDISESWLQEYVNGKYCSVPR